VALAFAAVAAATIIGFSVSRSGSTVDDLPVAAETQSTGTVLFRMEQQWSIRMKLALAEEAALARQVTSIGRVVPSARNRAVVAPPVSGVITSGDLPRVGQEVDRGQVLAVLAQIPTAVQAHELRIESMKLEAERRRLTEEIRESEVRLNLARTEFERAQRLYEGKASSLRQLQAAEAEYKAAQTHVAAATQQLEALRHETETTAYEVRAPISGVIASVRKAVGEQVAPGETMMEIVNLDTVWVEAPIFEQDLGRLRLQESAAFTTASFPNTEFRGTLINLGAVIDEQTRAAAVLFEVPNRDRKLRIGMQANVRMDAAERVTAVLIPKEAVLDNEGEKIVYVLISGETFQRQRVQLGDEYGDKVAVLSGLTPGQRVVTQGAYQLKLQELRPADAGAHTHEM
jgi:RND family efflux transporter MFP subunit